VPRNAKATNMATARFLVVTYLRSEVNVDAQL